MPEPVREYLTAALDIMQAHSVHRQTVYWEQVRHVAFITAASARVPAATYPAIDAALHALGDRHSFFQTPSQARTLSQTDVANFPGLTGRALPGPIGYLSLPGLSGSPRTVTNYLHQGRATLAAATGTGVCGWVIDLRRNTGGNMWPMLGVIAPILGDGHVGSFVGPDGPEGSWTIHNGVALLDGQPLYPDQLPTPPMRTDLPTAVLTGPATASAGEAVLVALLGRTRTRTFGMDTAGLPTANEAYQLPDGALIILTTARDADRTGRAYSSPIHPDEQVGFTDTEIDTPGDRARAAATGWLNTQPTCHHR